MNRASNVLFWERDLRNLVESYDQEMLRAIDGVNKNTLLNTSIDNLCDYYEQNYRIHVPELREEEITVDQTEAQVDISQDRLRMVPDRSKPAYVSGAKIVFSVPFDGDPKIFKCRPSTYTSMLPHADVHRGELHLIYTLTDHDSTALKAAFDRDLGELRKWLGWVSKDVTPFNNSLRDKIRNRIENRREKLIKDQGLVSSLGFPLKERDDAARTYVAPTVRRKPSISRLSPGTGPFVPEPILEMQDYENILSVISNMTQVMERSPNTFHNMDEQDLRQHFLVQLNGLYEGQASGETFNFEGKTDILIRVEGKNIFIAECKFWRGPDALKEAIDQLLSYATWRDTKTALIVFNRNQNFSDVLGKIPETVESHPNHLRQLSYGSESDFRFALHHRDDPARELILTIMVFEVPL